MFDYNSDERTLYILRDPIPSGSLSATFPVLNVLSPWICVSTTVQRIYFSNVTWVLRHYLNKQADTFAKQILHAFE